MNVSNKKLFFAGLALWILSFLGEINGYQPGSSIGLMLSYILTFSALFLWARAYQSLHGYYPKFWQMLRPKTKSTIRNPFGGLKESIQNLPRTLSFGMIFLMIISLAVQVMFRQSGALDAAKRYCETNGVIRAKTGPIKYYSLFVTGSIEIQNSTGESNLSFTIIGSKGNFSTYALLTMQNDEWTVDKVSVSPR